MLKHESSMCSSIVSSSAREQCTKRNGRTNEDLLTFSRYLSLRIAREKTAEKQPAGGGDDRLLRDLAALARRVDEQPERFGVQGAADA
jgi:hypothetical protein